MPHSTTTQINLTSSGSAAHRMIQRRDRQVSPRQAWQAADTQLGAVNKTLIDIAEDAGELLEAAHHQLEPAGKRFRARTVLSIGTAAGASSAEAVTAAAACELLHNASLVHDDIQDRDEVRRFRPTVWKQFGDETALLLGDWLHTRAYELLVQGRIAQRHRVALLERFFSTTQKMIEGQAQEMYLDLRTSTLGDYEEAALGKSGALLGLAAESALLISDCGDDVADHAGKALALLGLAYQIQDDLADLDGTKEGRPAGSDLARGRLNAPTLAYLTAQDPRPTTLPTLAILRRDTKVRQRTMELQSSALERFALHLTQLPPHVAAVVEAGAVNLLPGCRELLAARTDDTTELLAS